MTERPRSAAPVETVREPSAGWQVHRRLATEMAHDLRRAPTIARRLLLRNWRVEYRQTLLGGLLALLPALALAAWAVLADRAKVLNVGPLAVPYPAWVLLGVMLWHTFLESLTIQLETLERERPLLAKTELPPEGSILAAIGRVALNLVAKTVLVVLVFAASGVPARPAALLAPLAIAGLMVLGTACGLLLAPLHALYRDVGKALPAITTFWFLMTPVFYAPPRHGVFGWLVRHNPVTPLLATARDWITLGHSAELGAAAAVALVALLLLPLAWFFYRLALPFVLERTP